MRKKSVVTMSQTWFPADTSWPNIFIRTFSFPSFFMFMCLLTYPPSIKNSRLTKIVLPYYFVIDSRNFLCNSLVSRVFEYYSWPGNFLQKRERDNPVSLLWDPISKSYRTKCATQFLFLHFVRSAKKKKERKRKDL